jgi:hypothetical protein
LSIFVLDNPVEVLFLLMDWLICRLFFEKLFSSDKRRLMSSARVHNTVQVLMTIYRGQLLQGREV